MEEGVRLMAVGMLTVFAFLTLLVGLMRGSAAFFEAFADRFPEAPLGEPTVSGSGAGAGEEEIAVVLAAITAHRRGLHQHGQTRGQGE